MQDFFLKKQQNKAKPLPQPQPRRQKVRLMDGSDPVVLELYERVLEGGGVCWGVGPALLLLGAAPTVFVSTLCAELVC